MNLVEKYLGEAKNPYDIGMIGSVDVDKLFKEEEKKFLKKYPDLRTKWHMVIKGRSMGDFVKKQMKPMIEKAKKKLEKLNLSDRQIESEVKTLIQHMITDTALEMAKQK